MLWIFLLPIFLLANDLVPVHFEGRIRPLYAEGGKLQDSSKVLPDRFDTTWHPLNAIDNEDIPLLYDRDTLLPYYQQGEWDKLSEKLAEQYVPLEGTPFLESPGATYYYPTLNQLWAEKIYLSFPWLWVVFGVYFLSLLTGWLSPFIIAILLHTGLLAARIYILGRPPVANMMETLLYVPWISSLACLFYSHKAVIILGSLLACTLFAILEIYFNPKGLENLQAVLNSNYWLTIHVMLIVASYGVLILNGLIAHYALFKNDYSKEKILLKTLYLGVFLLIPGTILGGVWAAESWGRFWDWDPKESWAFISSVLYVTVIHAYRTGKIGMKGLAIGSIIGFNAITFTWYGVNYILGTGLHSYGFGNGGQIYYYLFLIIEFLIISWALLADRLKNNKKLC